MLLHLATRHVKRYIRTDGSEASPLSYFGAVFPQRRPPARSWSSRIAASSGLRCGPRAVKVVVMRRALAAPLVALLALLMLACGQPDPTPPPFPTRAPIATPNLTATPLPGSAPTPRPTPGPITFEWDFEDGTADGWDLREDTRIAARETDVTRYAFLAPGGGDQISVEVRLEFRRAFKALAAQNDWDLQDILMEAAALSVPG